MIKVILSQFWVQRLGWTLLHFLWQGTVIAVVYAMLRSLLKRSLSAQGRYVLACAALMAMSVAPPLTFLLIPNAYRTGSWTLSPAEWQRLLPAVVVLWLLGVLVSIRLLGGWRFTARLRSTSHPAPREWMQTLERIARRVGATQPVHLLVSSLVDVPTVIGWLRPAILVPVEFLTGLPFEHITALLAHEMAHIRRYDYISNFLQSIAESVLFYHPAVWWISEQIRAEREQCCDDLAVAATGDVLAYARALAELESRQPSRPTPALAANGGSLVNRVRRLIEPAHTIANSAPGPATAWAMTLLWLAGVGAAMIHDQHPPPEPVQSTVAAPPLNAVLALAGKTRSVLLYDPLLSVHQVHSGHHGENAEPQPELMKPEDEYRMVTDLQEYLHSNAAVNGNTLDLTAESVGTLQAPAQDPSIAVDRDRENEVRVQRNATPPLAPVQKNPEDLPPPTQTFRAATKLVQIDVIARSKGAPATGLTKDDFTLLDNGRLQNIASFSVTSPQIHGPSPILLPAGAVSNRLESRGDSPVNATVLLIDQRNTPQSVQAFAIQRIVKFLHKESNPHRMGIYIFGRDGLRAVQEITDDAELLRRAADSLKPRDPRDQYSGMKGIDRTRPDTKHVLEMIARHLAGVPGRKGLIWVTASFPFSSDFQPEIEEAAHALNDANVAFYAVDASGLAGALSRTSAISNAEWRGAETGKPRLQLAQETFGPGSISFPAETMSVLADLTGGLALYNTNGIEDSIKHALDDAELTYTLLFYPQQEEAAAGAWHKLKIEVSRPEVRVRYRSKYFAPGKLDQANDRPTLPELLKAPLDATQLQLVAEAVTDRARPDFRQVRASVDLRNVHLENQNNTWAGAVDVSFFMGGSRTARTVTRRVEIPDKQLADALKDGIVIDDSIGVDAQAGELLIVAQDRATGAAGSVRVPLR